MGARFVFSDAPVRTRWYWIASEVASLVLTASLLMGIHFGTSPRNAPVQPQELWKYAYMHKDDQILNDSAIIMVIALSVLVIVPFLLLIKLCSEWRWTKVRDEALLFVFGYANGNFLILLITEIFKKCVGRFRPDFLSRCLNTVDPAVIKAFIDQHPIGGHVRCEQDWTKYIEDGRQSWPSGHSSGSCFAFIFIAMWIFERLGAYRRIGFGRILLPIYVAIFPGVVMATRVMDNRHNPLDVVSGGLIGVVVAYFTFRFYYPTEKCPPQPPPFPPTELPTTMTQVSPYQSSMIISPPTHKYSATPPVAGDHSGFRSVPEPTGLPSRPNTTSQS